MRSLGFGLERIGLVVLKAPLIVGAAAVVLTVLAAATLPRTSFDGRLIDILSENRAFQSYLEVKENFRDASHDAFLLVESPTLFTVDGMSDLRFLQIDLSLSQAAQSVYSIFSLGEIDFETGGFDPALPANFTSDLEVAEALAALTRDQAAARTLVALEANIAMIVVTLDAEINADNEIVADLARDLQQTLDEVTPPGFTVTMTGIPAIQVAVAGALQDDQWRMALIGMVIGTLIAFVVFRSLLAAIVCAAPAGIAVIWLLGVLNTFGIEINFLFIILPSLTLILALVDSIVLFFHWQSANAENGEMAKNLRSSILRVGPASAMTSITTALAFASLAYAQNPALQMLAWLGVVSVAIAFIAFIIVLPLGCLALSRLQVSAGRRRPSFARLGNPAGRWALRARHARIAVALVIAAILGVIHFQVGSNFVMERYLPPESAITEYETRVGEEFGGTVPLFAIVPVPDGGTFHDPASRNLIATAADVFASVLGNDSSLSLANVWDTVDPEETDAAIEALTTADPVILDRVLSHDQRLMLVTAQLPSVISGDETKRIVEALELEMAEAGIGDRVSLTGFPILSGIEIPGLVDELRVGLLIAIALAVTAIAIASGSIGLALASLVPNLLPVLSVEAVLWLMGYDHDLTSMIALTVAFGIGIDNAIHLINMYRVNRGDGRTPDEALSHAVRVVGPALMASTAILGVTYLSTQISEMPSISLLGQLIIATLIAALIANLVFLPSFIAVLARKAGGKRSPPTDTGGS